MAIIIQLESKQIDITIGERIFKADVTEQSIKLFSEKVMELKEIEQQKFESDSELKDFIESKSREALGIIFEENPCDYILEVTGRVFRLLGVLMDLKVELEMDPINNVQQKVNKYTKKFKK